MGLALFVMASGARAETIWNEQSPSTCMADKNNGQRAVVWSRNGNSDQNWTVNPVAGSWGFTLSNASGTGCLGPASASDPGRLGDALYMVDCSRQFQWVVLGNGFSCSNYVTLNSFMEYLNTGDRTKVFAIGVAGASASKPPTSGQGLVLWTLTGEANQRWCRQ